MRTLIAVLLFITLPGLLPAQSSVSSLSGGHSLLVTSVFPTLPGGYTYSNLQNEATSCPTYTNPSATTQSSGAPFACWIVDSINATGVAGAGIEAPTAMYFGIKSVDGGIASKSAGGALETEVSNMPPVVTTGSGSSGGNSIVVTSITNLNNKQGEVVTGTGIGSGAQICYASGAGICTAAWDGVSKTIPLTVANSGNVSGNITFTTNFTSNALFYRRIPCGSGAGTCTPTEMVEDIWYLIPSTSNKLQAIEFDPDLLMGNYEELASYQCILNTQDQAYNHLRFWDGTSQSWVEQAGHTYNCASMHTYDVWHHLQSYTTYDPTQTVTSPMTGALSGNTITVSSVAGIPTTFSVHVRGTGIGSNAQICTAAGQGICTAAWDKVSTTIPLTVANSSTTAISGSAEFGVGSYKYQTFAIDGVVLYQNLNLQYGEHYNGYNSAQLMSIQNQTDQQTSASRSLPGSAIYYDQETMTAR